MTKKASDQDPRELFEAASFWYNAVYEGFAKLRFSSLGKKYKEALSSFLHDAMGAASSLEYCLANDNLPERGRPSMRWVDYNKTLTNIGLMELVLELWEGTEHED